MQAPVHATTSPERTSRPRILVVDDDPDASDMIRHMLVSGGYDATAYTSPRGVLEQLEVGSFDLVLSDVSMPEMSGVELCQRIVTARPLMPVILLTGRGDMNMVISAMRGGATDFLTKPFDSDSLVASVTRALRRPLSHDAGVSSSEEGPGADSAPPLKATKQSAVMGRLHGLIADISASTASILLQGETGAGKEVIARAIHASGPFKRGPFTAVNCAAMPAGLLESELFGHVRGAFTDARSATKGCFVEANGGTLLLDEIGELPLAVQPKLLRALQERRVRPVGGTAEVAFDCRLIAATNRDLEKEVAAGRFREDLFYRIDVIRVTVPPLRERADDILVLARHFLERFAHKSQTGVTIGGAAAEKLLAYAWPGNVRELENCMARAVAMCGSSELTEADLPEKVRNALSLQESPIDAVVIPGAPSLTLAEQARRHIFKTIELAGGNRTRAAKLLGIDRRTLHRHLKWYGAAHRG